MNVYECQRSRSFIDLGPRSLIFTFSNFFSLEIARPVEAKFHVEPPWDGGITACSNGPGHMTSMTAMPIYGKSLKKIFSGTKQPMTLRVGMQNPWDVRNENLFKCSRSHDDAHIHIW